MLFALRNDDAPSAAYPPNALSRSGRSHAAAERLGGGQHAAEKRHGALDPPSIGLAQGRAAQGRHGRAHPPTCIVTFRRNGQRRKSVSSCELSHSAEARGVCTTHHKTHALHRALLHGSGRAVPCTSRYRTPIRRNTRGNAWWPSVDRQHMAAAGNGQEKVSSGGYVGVVGRTGQAATLIGVHGAGARLAEVGVDDTQCAEELHRVAWPPAADSP